MKCVLMCVRIRTSLCGSLGLPTLRPGCSLRRRSSHNPLCLSISCETGEREAYSKYVTGHKKMLYTSSPNHTGFSVALINIPSKITISLNEDMIVVKMIDG